MHILQEVCCSAKTEAGTISGGDLRLDHGRLIGTTDQAVTFDGIFGAFFDGYWARHTAISDLALVFDLVGRLEITIDRITSETGCAERVVRATVEGAGEQIIVPVPFDGGGSTRLVLSMRLVADASVSGLAWATRTPPVRPVGLNVVICTYDRDNDVAATLGELLRQDCGIQRAIVINQGRPGLVNRLKLDRCAPYAELLTVIDQANLGGAGGFGRGMLESLLDDRCSHILLMDDDVDLDASSVKRLVAVLRYLRSDHAIGGAMLDRSDRNRLCSVGDVLHSTRPEIRNLVGPGSNDITAPETSAYLARDHKPDFNGWWFCAFSKAEMERVGLPLPMFIRGDDVEYGYRLACAGTSTLAWPGLAVWHEPFHAKRHPWHYFYDRRNSLFLCEMHGRLGRRRLLLPLVTGFLNHLLRFDYDRATCITLGLRAFNEGASALAAWRGDDHARLAREFPSREQPMTTEIRSDPIPVSRMPVLLLFLIQLVKDLAGGGVSEGKPAQIAAGHWRPAMRNRPRHVRVHYEDSRTAAEFHYDAHRTRRCSRAFAREIRLFMVRPWRPTQLKRLVGPDFWARYTSQP